MMHKPEQFGQQRPLHPLHQQHGQPQFGQAHHPPQFDQPPLQFGHEFNQPGGQVPQFQRPGGYPQGGQQQFQQMPPQRVPAGQPSHHAPQGNNARSSEHEAVKAQAPHRRSKLPENPRLPADV